MDLNDARRIYSLLKELSKLKSPEIIFALENEKFEKYVNVGTKFLVKKVTFWSDAFVRSLQAVATFYCAKG